MKRIFGLIFFLLLAISSSAANMPLEIIQPRIGLTTLNRYYKAYPGLEYNVRAGVIGGAYPYAFELITAPIGMTINAGTGEITWANPVVSGSPHPVTLKVTDQESTTVTVSWTVTVTTTGFLFVDAVNGNASVLNGGTGTGTAANPFKYLKDIYEGNDYAAKSRSGYQGQFVYFKTGTYLVDTYIENPGTVDERTAWTNVKPVVWLAYPGGSPVIDFNNIPAFIHFYTMDSNKIYIDGLEIKNMYRNAFKHGANVRAVFRNLTMHNLGPSPGNNNQAFIMVTGADAPGQYTMYQDNTMYNLDHGCAIKLYAAEKYLIEDNVIHDISDSLGLSLEGIALKASVIRTTVRHNTLYNIPTRAIDGNGMSGPHGDNDGTYPTRDNEICYNYVYDSGNHPIEQNLEGRNGPTYIYRNTIEGKVLIVKDTTGTGPFYIDNNVMVNADAGIYDIDTDVGDAQIITTGNVTGVPANNIFDANGHLLGNYRTIYLGLAGWETSREPPHAPTNLRIINN